MDSKGILEFNRDTPEGETAFQLAVQSGELFEALMFVSDQIFRPANKHGYSDSRIPPLDDWTEDMHNLVDVLSDLFHRELENRGITLF